MNVKLNQLTRIIFAIFISLIGVVSAFANPGGLGSHREDRQAVRAARQAQNEDRRAARQGQNEDRRAIHQNQQGPLAGGQNVGGQNVGGQNIAGEQARRNGRLTREERRDLRRQINEAGQGIYANPPKP